MNQLTLPLERPLIVKAFKPGSQCFSILEYLRAGNTLTPLQCFEKFGVLAAHSRMSELREAGWPVQCRLIKVGNATVGEYSL